MRSPSPNRLAPRHRPACMQIGLVVLVFPAGAAAVASVAGDGDHAAVFAFFLAVAALHQLGVAGGAAPVALDAAARLAQRHLLLVLFAGAQGGVHGWAVG